MENLVQTSVLDTPVANQLGVGGSQVDLLVGQLEEGGVLVWTDAVGAELIEGFVFLLGASREAHTRLLGIRKRADEHVTQSLDATYRPD